MARLQATVVVDYNTKLPLVKASVYDCKENPIALTDAGGRFQSINGSKYPLTVRYIGYAPEEIPSVGADTVMMLPLSYDLPELTVTKKNQNRLHLVAFVRNFYTETYDNDTIVTLIEGIVDCSIRDKDLSSRFSLPKTRMLERNIYAYFKTKDMPDSVDNKREGVSGLACCDIPGVTNIPASLLTGNETATWVNDPEKTFEKWVKNGTSYTYSKDLLGATDNHSASPWILKMMGLNGTLTNMYRSYKFDVASGDIANAENFVFGSDLFTFTGKGKRVRRDYNTTSPVTWNIYSELYVVDRAYLTKEECKEYKPTPEIYEKIRELVPPLSPEMQRIKLRVQEMK